MCRAPIGGAREWHEARLARFNDEHPELRATANQVLGRNMGCRIAPFDAPLGARIPLRAHDVERPRAPAAAGGREGRESKDQPGGESSQHGASRGKWLVFRGSFTVKAGASLLAPLGRTG